MTTEWIVYVLLVAGLLACAAAAADDVLRRAAMPTRWVWVAALLATTVFTAMSTRRTAPTFNPLVTAKVSVSALPTSATRGGLLETIAHARAWAGRATARIVGAAHYGLSASVRVSLIVAWVTTSTGMLAILFLVHRGMDRERRRWPLALLFDVAVRITPSEGPAVMGITTPEIVVPRWLLVRSAEEQRLVVMHEREHITARDHLLLLGGLFIAALLPWHPVVWWAVSRLRLAIELDCDARVLHRGVQVRSYGNLLIDIAGQCAGHRVGALALADQPSHLERRLLAMKNMTPRFTLVRTGSLAAIAMLAVAMACEARLPTSADVDKMDVAGAERAMSKTQLLDGKGAMIYVVNDKIVSAQEAHAIPSERIATMNVDKGATTEDGASLSRVRIITTDYTPGGGPMKVRVRIDDGASRSEGERGILSKSAFTGLIFVDGVRAPQNVLSNLKPEMIESVEVLKGAAATKAYADPAAANGVITITTKHAKQ